MNNDDNIQLQYANQSLLYTTQFIASMSDEEVVLDCGSIIHSSAGSQQLPVHTRLALPWSAVERLEKLLGELLESRKSSSVPTEGAVLPPLHY